MKYLVVLLLITTGCYCFSDYVRGPTVETTLEIKKEYAENGQLIKKTEKKVTISKSAEYRGNDAKSFNTGGSKVSNGTAEAGSMSLSFLESSNMRQVALIGSLTIVASVLVGIFTKRWLLAGGTFLAGLFLLAAAQALEKFPGFALTFVIVCVGCIGFVLYKIAVGDFKREPTAVV